MTQTIDRITMNMFYNGEEKYLKQSTELQWICFTMEKKNTSNSPLNYNEYVLQWRRKCLKCLKICFTIDSNNRITMNMFYNGEEKYLKQSTELQWICFTMEKKNTSNNPLNYNEYVLQWRRKIPQTVHWITINMLYNGEEKYLKQSTELQWICFTMEKKNTSNNRLNYNEYVLQWRRKIPQTIDWITMNMFYNGEEKYLKPSTELQ